MRYLIFFFRGISLLLVFIYISYSIFSIQILLAVQESRTLYNVGFLIYSIFYVYICTSNIFKFKKIRLILEFFGIVLGTIFYYFSALIFKVETLDKLKVEVGMFFILLVIFYTIRFLVEKRQKNVHHLN